MCATQRRRPWRYVATAALLTAPLVAALSGVQPAHAAVNRYVATPANGGSDASNPCTNQATPCATIGHAVAVAANGDNVVVGAGTFNESVTVPANPSAATNLTITGSPQGTTIHGFALPPVVSLQAGTTVTLAQLTVTGGAENGGVANSGSAVLFRVAITGNGSGLDFGFGEGGGINNAAGATLQLIDSTVANNNAFGSFSKGGGISNNGTMTITDSTIAGNGAGQIGGGGIANSGTISIAGTIVANNTAGSGANCSGPVIDNGHNLDSGTTCQFGPSSQSNVNPLLGSLANNGGPTFTMAIGAGSPAVDAGRPACTVVDQRRVPRPQGARCDVGAYEYAPGVLTGLIPTSGPTAGGTAVRVNGHGFTLATGVTFGPNAATLFSVVNDTAINVIAPPGTGTVPVRVQTPDGSGPDTAASNFTYVSVHNSSLTANPVIARLQPLKYYYKLSARLVDTTTGLPAAGQTITFSSGGTVLCSGVTNANGVASCTDANAVYAAVQQGSYLATFAGTPSLAAASSSAGLIA